MDKQGGSTFNAFLIALLIFIAGGIFLLFLNSSSGVTGNIVNEGEKGNVFQELGLQEKCKEVQVPYEEVERYTESVQYTDQECENVLLAYNKQVGNCVPYEDNFFVADEPASYSVKINNLDSEKGGTFEVEIGFKIGGELVTKDQSKYIDPLSSYTFSTSQMATVESCHYRITGVPSKTVCRDVLKYKDVPKTKTTTKYRTETVCE